jgi:O-antigen/teichoic acid export membrane protein
LRSAHVVFDARHKQSLNAAIFLVCEVAYLTALFVADRLLDVTLPAIGALFLAKWALLLLLQFAVYLVWLHPARLRVDSVEFKLLVKEGWPVMLVGLLTTLTMSMGTILVRFFHGGADAAIYGLAAQFAAAMTGVGYIATRILQPHMAGAYGTHPGFLRKFAAFLVLYYTTLVICSWCFAYVVIRFGYPASFAAAALPTAVLLVAAAFQGAFCTIGIYLITLHRQRALLGVVVGMAAVYLMLAIPLVRSWGYWGATAASLTCCVASLVAGVWLLRLELSSANRCR